MTARLNNLVPTGVQEVNLKANCFQTGQETFSYCKNNEQYELKKRTPLWLSIYRAPKKSWKGIWQKS